jgi:hypothetical protein
MAWRYLWASPATLLGLILATLACYRGRASLVSGVLEVHGPLLRWVLRRLAWVPGGAAAIALGHVVVGCDAKTLEVTRSHERVHVRQCERWGPLFVPVYLLASLWVALRGGNVYRDNPFEVDAYDR